MLVGRRARADSELRFELGVDPRFYEGRKQQLVREERSRVAKVEDERMAQRIRLLVEGGIARQNLKQLFVAVEGGMEVGSDLAALGLGIAAVQKGRTRKGYV